MLHIQHLVNKYHEEDLQTGHQEVLKTKIQVAGKLPPRQDIFCVAGKLKSPASSQQESRILPLHVSSLGAREGRPDIFPRQVAYTWTGWQCPD